MDTTLTADNPTSKEFTFKGDCCICATGQGQIRIQRKVGTDFCDITDNYGDPIYYVSKDGLLFNGNIYCGSRVPHRIVASTTGEVKISVRGA